MTTIIFCQRSFSRLDSVTFLITWQQFTFQSEFVFKAWTHYPPNHVTTTYILSEVVFWDLNLLPSWSNDINLRSVRRCFQGLNLLLFWSHDINLHSVRYCFQGLNSWSFWSRDSNLHSVRVCFLNLNPHHPSHMTTLAFKSWIRDPPNYMTTTYILSKAVVEGWTSYPPFTWHQLTFC